MHPEYFLFHIHTKKNQGDKHDISGEEQKDQCMGKNEEDVFRKNKDHEREAERPVKTIQGYSKEIVQYGLFDLPGKEI